MSATTALIRDVEWSDVSILANLTTELGYPTTTADMESRLRNISKQTTYRTVVATLEDQVVGYIGLNRHFFWEYNGEFVRIQALVVKKDCRRLGIGRLLIQHAEDWAIQVGARLLVLNCGNKETREAAHQFYPQMGFIAKSTGYMKFLDSTLLTQ